MILTRTAHSVVLAFGWRRAAIALVAGAVSALAMAPFNAWPVLFLTFPVLIWLVDGSADAGGRGFWAAAGAGWCFGFGYFVVGLYWIGNAFLVDAKTFGWLLPIAVCGLPAYLALYTGLGLGVARLIWVRGPLRILALAVTLTAAEWLRGHLLTRLSLEHLRLRAHRAAGAGANRVADRHLGSHVLERGDLRHPGGARRRFQGHAASLSCAGHWR